MFKFNLILSLMFLVNTVFTPPLFSYQTADRHSEENWVDESRDYKPVVYRKARCPRCGIEFYYILGKESPHAHWVHYEVSEEEESDSTALLTEKQIGMNKIGEEKEKKKLFDLFMQKKETQAKSVKTPRRESLPFLTSEGFEIKSYELRQKLTCPYDGYSFFPEGEIIEERKLMKASLFAEEPSMIETSFSKSIPFGVSKELKQFGYDLFKRPEKPQEEEERESKLIGDSKEALTTLGMLKAAFIPAAASPVFSAQSSSQTAVIPVGPDYIVGPGDTLVINIWGSVQESFPVEVDAEGKIMLPKAGPLYIWGLEFKDAELRISERLNQFYTNFKVDVSMGKLREIQVYVMGEVNKPSSYRINSQSTVFQALYAAGGPTKLGSLRRIKLIRADGKTKKVDLYAFLLEGNAIEGSRLESGETIFVPPIGDVVAIAGNVKRPAIYETKSEILLSDLLDFSGGITPTGDFQRIQVERIKDNERRVMLDMELKRTDTGEFSPGNITMKNGDMVIVSPIVRLKHNFVSVLGNVERPGDYALSKDIKVSDLIKRAKGFMPGTYMHRAEIARVTKDRARQVIPVNLEKIMMGTEEDTVLNEWDILLIYSEAEINPPSFVEIDGAVNRPGKYELTPGMKVSDLIFKAGSVKPNEVIIGAELFHIMPGEQPAVRGIGVKRVSDADISIDKDIILRAGDALFIKSEPKLTERKIVSIKGEVRYPGTYSIREGERLSSLIERAGGFTDEAFLDGALFTRKTIREAQEKMRQRFIERENKTLLEEQQSMLFRRSERTTGPETISESLKIRREMIEFIAEAEIEGRMVINLKPLSELKNNKSDILLEDGDMLKIPQTPSAITVMGSVNNPTSVPFERAKGIEYYIRKTGGLTKHADKKGIYVIRANGEAVSKFMMAKRVSRGDTIVVPQEFKYWTPPGQLLRDTAEILSRIAIGIGIIAALD